MPKVINISMPEKLAQQVDEQAELEDRPRSAIFRDAVKFYMLRKRLTGASALLRELARDAGRDAQKLNISEQDVMRNARLIREKLYRREYGQA